MDSQFKREMRFKEQVVRVRVNAENAGIVLNFAGIARDGRVSCLSVFLCITCHF